MENKGQETNVFVHSGVVSRIRGRSIIVALDKNINCDSCRAKGACGVSDTANKEVEIIDADRAFRLNDPVEVTLKKNLGHKAVFWAYILPFITMISTLLLLSFFFEEWLAGLFALLVLVPYFAIIYALRNYFKKTFKISILRI